MLANQSLEKQTDYSIYSGKLEKQTPGVMECAILKTVDQDLVLWPHQKQLIWLRSIQIHDTEYCPNLVGMQKKCSQIKWYQYQSTILSFLNRYRMEWTGPKPNWRFAYPPPSLLGKSYSRSKGARSSKGLTQRLIGKTQGTTRMMEKNSRSLYTTKPENGRGPRTSSTTGESRKPRLGLVRE